MILLQQNDCRYRKKTVKVGFITRSCCSLSDCHPASRLALFRQEFFCKILCHPHLISHCIALNHNYFIHVFVNLVPSAVVGLDASFLNHYSLQVKWQPPLYPNGNITKYVITYQQSDYSVWEQDNIDWCTRQIVTSHDEKSGNKPENKPGNDDSDG